MTAQNYIPRRTHRDVRTLIDTMLGCKYPVPNLLRGYRTGNVENTARNTLDWIFRIRFAKTLSGILQQRSTGVGQLYSFSFRPVFRLACDGNPLATRQASLCMGLQGAMAGECAHEETDGFLVIFG